MAKENNTSIVSAATSYLPDNDMLRCCHLIQRNKKKQTSLPLTILFPASILSDVQLITTVFLFGYEQKPNTHPVKISYFLAYFPCFLKAWKTGLVYIHSEGGGCSLTKDNDNFSLLSDTVVKQHGFYCATTIHVIFSFRPPTPPPPSLCLFCTRIMLLAKKMIKITHRLCCGNSCVL